MRQKYLILLFGFSGVELASGALSFSLQFSNVFGDGVLSGIADEAGDLTSGLSWGILIAESGNDFSNPLTTELGISTADGTELAEGFRFFNGGLTTAIPIGTDPGMGVIGSTGLIEVSDPGIDTGDSFALIWFERGFVAGDLLEIGDQYGILTSSNFTVPGDGASLFPFGSEFNGVDPVRAASLTVLAIPEPASALLLGLASSLFLSRRRPKI